jgi:hypothetical protein
MNVVVVAFVVEKQRRRLWLDLSRLPNRLLPVKVKVKVKVHPITGHKGPEGE